MKSYRFIVTGDLYAKVTGKDESECFNKLQEWLEDNSPLSNWEILDDIQDRVETDITIINK